MRKQTNPGTVKVIPLGGLNEIGKNMTVFEYKDEIIIVDCGLCFPEDEMLGIDIVIPDFSYLHKNRNKIKAMFITHGHEDHIGAIPYFLKQFGEVPVYGARLSLGLIENKLKEHGISGRLMDVTNGDVIKAGNFSVEVIRMTHSIPGSAAYAIKTPLGYIFHTGDFKIDYTPLDGDPINFQRLATLGGEGVLLMMADSTNAGKRGYTASEKTVGEALDDIFAEAESRIIIATFASNVYRVQRIIDAAVKNGRCVAMSGRSMVNVVATATELGYMKIPKGALVDINKIRNMDDDKVVIITTGSQGEPMSALTRMANSEHKMIQVKKGDTIIFSSNPIPGNEKPVSTIINKLYEKSANVIHSDIADIHVSGHASEEELKLIHSLIKPKYFLPVHGEYRHLLSHSRIAEHMGMDSSNIFMMENGDILEISTKGAVRTEKAVPSGNILVDGLGVGDVGNIVLRDRKLLSEGGLIIVVAAISKETGYVCTNPEIISRGFVYVRESEDLIEAARNAVKERLEKYRNDGVKDWSVLKNGVKDELRDFIYKQTKRNPVILPIFIEV
ncbi:MAG: ribonuclease J [Bacillota bacterium]|nr:ribonuclease J [Bacillota bacterium]